MGFFLLLNKTSACFKFMLPKSNIYLLHIPFEFELDILLPVANYLKNMNHNVVFVASKNNQSFLNIQGFKVKDRNQVSWLDIFGARGHIFCDTESIDRDSILKIFAQNICYIPYGISVSAANYSRRQQYGLLLHRLARKIFVPSNIVKQRYLDFSGFSHDKVVVASHPKSDLVVEYTGRKMKRSSLKKKVLWNCHYTRSWGNFDILIGKVVSMVTNRCDLEFIFRPHPFFDFSEWQIPEDLSMKWLDLVEQGIIKIDNKSNYCSQIADIDILITDGSSVIYDFMVLNRPMIYCVSQRNNQLFDEEFDYLCKNHFVCDEKSDFENLFQQACEYRHDPIRQKETYTIMQLAEKNTFNAAFRVQYLGD